GGGVAGGDGTRRDAGTRLDRGEGAGEPVQRDIGTGHRRVQHPVGGQRGHGGTRRVAQGTPPAAGPVDDHLTGGEEAALEAVAVGQHHRPVARPRCREPHQRGGAVVELDRRGEVGRDGGCRRTGGDGRRAGGRRRGGEEQRARHGEGRSEYRYRATNGFGRHRAP